MNNLTQTLTVKDPITEQIATARKQPNPILFCVSRYVHWSAMAAEANLQVLKYSNYYKKRQEDLKISFLNHAKTEEHLADLQYNINKFTQTADIYLDRAHKFKTAFLMLNKNNDEVKFNYLVQVFNQSPKALK